MYSTDCSDDDDAHVIQADSSVIKSVNSSEVSSYEMNKGMKNWLLSKTKADNFN